MWSSSDAGRLMIAASFSNLKPVVRISFCFRPARLYTLHGESSHSPWPALQRQQRGSLSDMVVDAEPTVACSRAHQQGINRFANLSTACTWRIHWCHLGDCTYLAHPI